MSKELSPLDTAKSPAASTKDYGLMSRRWRTMTATLLIAGLALVPSLVTLAQRVRESQQPINVTGVSARQQGGGAVVTVEADGPLNRTQTWQEGDKFHLVLPYAAGRSIGNLPRGVKVNRVSNSLEIVVSLKSGASVTVDPNFNRLNLIVNGGLNANSNEANDTYARQSITRAPEASAAREDYESAATRPARERRSTAANAASMIPFFSKRSVATDGKPQASSRAASQMPASASQSAGENKTAQTVAPPAAETAPVNQTTQLAQPQDANLAPAASNAANETVAPQTAQSQTAQSSSLFSTIFSTTGVAIMLAVGLLMLAYLRLRPASSAKDEEGFESVEEESARKTEQTLALEMTKPTPLEIVGEQKPKERRRFMRRKSDRAAAAQQDANANGQALEARNAPQVVVQAALFGAYRVDQEVGKLVLGQPHRMDVLASRAPDDRRAIETSLLKALTAPETDEDGRRRARQALEEYGFLARHSAAVLLAPEAVERVASARTLGEVGAPTALPFLLEALYDSEAIVRTQVVSSIGELRIPSAIGALLDMARRYPEMSNALLSQTLNACSLDALDFGADFDTERALLGDGTGRDFNGEITGLEPSAIYEQLPEFLEDETLAEALERLENADVEARASAARRLAQFQTQQSVAALTALAAQDAEASVRAAAVASLGEIDHESVFAPVLMAFADEAREVQAAAARALSRLSFDRADAYVRIIETADGEALGKVARACIKARMAAQAIDRLASEDRRQAYEAFSLLSLLARAGETAPMIEAIAEHSEQEVQMAAIRLLGLTGRPEVAQQFRQLAVRDGMPEKVRTALLEVVYKIDQALPV